MFGIHEADHENSGELLRAESRDLRVLEGRAQRLRWREFSHTYVLEGVGLQLWICHAGREVAER